MFSLASGSQGSLHDNNITRPICPDDGGCIGQPSIQGRLGNDQPGVGQPADPIRIVCQLKDPA